MRRLLALLALVGGWLAAVALYRRASPAQRQRVDVYFDDGSLLSLAEGTPEAGRLLAVARDAIRAVRLG